MENVIFLELAAHVPVMDSRLSSRLLLFLETIIFLCLGFLAIHTCYALFSFGLAGG